MCRYAFKGPYKRHFACFHCRKGFKRAPLTERDDPASDPAPCPDCGARMSDMGLDFAPPPKDQIEHWEVTEHLFRLGFSHHNCGCCGGFGRLPSRWDEVSPFLGKRLRQSDGQQLLGKFAAKKPR